MDTAGSRLLKQHSPNWQDIERCPIWKWGSILECDSCDGMVECWGTDILLPEGNSRSLGQIRQMPQILVVDN